MVFILLLWFGNAVEPRINPCFICGNQTVQNSGNGIKVIFDHFRNRHVRQCQNIPEIIFYRALGSITAIIRLYGEANCVEQQSWLSVEIL